MYHTSFSQTLTQLQTLLLKASVLMQREWSKSKNAFDALSGQLNQIPVPSLRMDCSSKPAQNLSHIRHLELLLQQQIRLRETIQRIRQVLDAQNVYQVAVQELMNFCQADWVFILENGPRRLLSVESSLHTIVVDDGMALEMYRELTLAAAKLGKPLPMAVNGQAHQPMCQKWLIQYPGSWLLVPINLLHSHQLTSAQSNEPWGVFAIGCKDSTNHWTLLQQEQVKILVDEVAIALDHSFRHDQLKQEKQELQALALTDSLTGLANRRQFDRYFDTEWQRLTREKQPLTLILCDIDYFKLYNDYYGHPTGDICLAQVSDVLTRCMRRPGDLVARYGGEEFALILPSTDTGGGHSVALEIQKQLASIAIPHCKSSVSQSITLTMGVATILPESHRNPQELLKAADLALYHAKQQGRDRIYVHAHFCVHNDPPPLQTYQETTRLTSLSEISRQVAEPIDN
ncbi:MAG: diguanylate cyclase [Cyanobacteria bacterium P01_C01_bin.118]